MSLSPKAAEIHAEIADESTKLGDLKRLAKKIRTDHELALELWAIGDVRSRRLAVLIMDKKRFDQALVDQLDQDLQSHDFDERTQIMDWLFANQLTKTKAGVQLIDSWAQSPSPLQRRTFWYRQARLRWTGQAPPPNSPELVDAIEGGLADEVPEVQWAMNFTAGWIGIHQPELRDRCVALGERIGLYRDDPVSRGCTPNYLPEFIRIEAAKAGK